MRIFSIFCAFLVIFTHFRRFLRIFGDFWHFFGDFSFFAPQALPPSHFGLTPPSRAQNLTPPLSLDPFPPPLPQVGAHVCYKSITIDCTYNYNEKTHHYKKNPSKNHQV